MMSLGPQFKQHLRTGLNVTAGVATVAALGVGGLHSAQANQPAPMGGFVGNELQVQQTYDRLNENPNVPKWHANLGKQFPGFVNADERPVGGVRSWPDQHVVERQDDSLHVISDQRFQREHKAGHDLWIVGNHWPAGVDTALPPKPAPEIKPNVGNFP